MGLFNEVKREFIARPDESKNLIVYKWTDKNIRMFTQVTVQADEKAVFFKEGKVVGTLEPGQYRIDGQAIPFLNLIIDALTGGNLMIAELYFVSTREFPELPFGGPIDNIMDSKSGLAVGLRVYGTYSMKVVKPEDLIVKLVGTQGIESNDGITGWVQEQMLKDLRDSVTKKLASDELPVLGIAGHTEEIERLVLEGSKEHLAEYGIEVAKMGNFTINLKEEDEATLKNLMRDKAYAGQPGLADTAVKMGMAQGLSSGNAAASPAAAGVSAGVGAGMGMAMGQQMAQSTGQQPAQPGSTPAPEKTTPPDSAVAESKPAKPK